MHFSRNVLAGAVIFSLILSFTKQFGNSYRHFSATFNADIFVANLLVLSQPARARNSYKTLITLDSIRMT